ncbi:MAG: xanthine dehydrogenase family protein molybdopterin-binding subunit [Pseudomonadales bacterium]|nr:xanthine dehydrogenase family protein molybdopterin-binding subunit [Pseudomonadales bacterium]
MSTLDKNVCEAAAEKLVQAVQTEVQGKYSRRSFLKLTGMAGGGFVLASVLPAIQSEATDLGSLVGSAELNAFIKVSSDGRITIYSSNPEMGQGIKTALPMIIAEEMGAKWEDVEVLQSEIDAERFGGQFAGGSTTIPRSFDLMRQMGASAREMFIAAASIAMELPRDELKAAESVVSHTSGRSLSFGQLAALAAKQPLPDPASLEFKDREDYTIIGTSVSGVDNLVMVTGLALFGIDTKVPGMLFGAYEKCPAFGGRAVSANLAEIKKLSGITDAFLVEGNDNVRELMSGVAIVGTSTWAVFNAKKQLKVKWDESGASKDSWRQLVATAESLKGQSGEIEVENKGNVDAEFANDANKTISGFYEFPFVSHFCLEPMNCTADYKKGVAGAKDTVEVWVPTQAPTRVFPVAKSMFGLDAEQVTVHQTRLGGSFGRRIFTEYVCEVIQMSRHMGAPVKLTWTREDSVRHDFYRSGGFQELKGSVDKKGKLVAWEKHHIGMSAGGKPVIGAQFRVTEFPFLNLDNVRGTKTMLDIDTPCGPWRAPGANTTAFVVQSFLHELSQTAGRDHEEFLIEIMGEPRWFEPDNIRSLNTGRAVDVIKLAANKAGWGRKMPKGRALGLAFHFCHAGHVAEVAEVSVDKNMKLTVHKVTVAVDVGPIINMSGALSQVEGSIIDGLSTMVGQKITMERGRIEQSNFHDYKVLRIAAAPEIDVHFIQSDFGPTGLGEPALPPLAPAVGNAIYAATGHRVRKMPLTEEGYTV